MTEQEFDEKYKDYIEEGHYCLAIGDSEVIKFLDDIFQDLIKIPGFKFSQIKLKFGMCRFYSNLESSLGHLIEERINIIVKKLEEENKSI